MNAPITIPGGDHLIVGATFQAIGQMFATDPSVPVPTIAHLHRHHLTADQLIEQARKAGTVIKMYDRHASTAIVLAIREVHAADVTLVLYSSEVGSAIFERYGAHNRAIAEALDEMEP